jgi:hypothetical protein
MIIMQINGQGRSEMRFASKTLILYKIIKGQLRSNNIFGGALYALKILAF